MAFDDLLRHPVKEERAPGRIEAIQERLFVEASDKSGLVEDTLVSSGVAHPFRQSFFTDDLAPPVAVGIDVIDTAGSQLPEA
jgi:hypothetical protein